MPSLNALPALPTLDLPQRADDRRQWGQLNGAALALTLAQYGWTAKVFEVVERTLTPEGLLRYTLRETAAGVWDWAFGEATIGDLAPDTELPSPFGLPAILQNLSANEDAIRLGDGTIVTQAVVTWDQSPSPFVANGGTIQYQTAKVGTPWGTGSLPGDSVTVTLGPLQVGVAYVFRARAVNATFVSKPVTEEGMAGFISGAALRLKQARQ